MTVREMVIALKTVLKEVESFNITTFRKDVHSTKLHELRQLFYKCESIHFLYDPDKNDYFLQYQRDVTAKTKKALLDKDLRLCLYFLASDIKSHIRNLLERNQDKIW